MAGSSKAANTCGELPKVGLPALAGLGADSTTAVENEEHCDFKKLRSLLIRTHMLDLIQTTEELHYETYRQQQMETRKFGEPKPKKQENPKFKEEEELLRKKFTEQVKLEESRFRQWEQHLIAERDRLNKDLEQAHSCVGPWLTGLD
jgi:cell division control protein 12